jgi:hypothetical protein
VIPISCLVNIHPVGSSSKRLYKAVQAIIGSEGDTAEDGSYISWRQLLEYNNYRWKFLAGATSTSAPGSWDGE